MRPIALAKPTSPHPSGLTAADLARGQEHRLTPVGAPRNDLEWWLHDVCAGVGRGYVLRQSSKSKRNALKTLVADLKADRDVPTARSLDDDYDLEQVIRGEAPGQFVVRMRHLRGGGTSNEQVGSLLRIRDTLVVIALTSAAKSNLDADQAEDRGNAFVELLRTVMRRLSRQLWADDPRESMTVRFGEVNRMVRDEGHGATLLRTVRHYDVTLQSRNNDDLTGTDAMVLQMLFGLAAKGIEDGNTSMLKGKDSKLAGGGWLGTPPPFTHRYSQDRRARKDGVIVPKIDPATLRSIVEAVIARADADKDGNVSSWNTLAIQLGRAHDLTSRAIDDERGLAELAEPGAALRRALGEDYIQGWRTGAYPWVTALPSNARFNEESLKPHQRWVESKGLKKLETLLPVPAPQLPCATDPSCRLEGHLDDEGEHLSHGWGIPEAWWDRLVEVVRPDPSNTGGGGNRTKALTGAMEWTDTASGRERCLKPHNDTYVVLEREAGSGPAWRRYGPKRNCWVVCSFDAAALEHTVGRELNWALRKLDTEVAELTWSVTSTGAAQAADRESRRELATKALTSAQRAVRRAKRARDAAQDDLDENQGDEELELDVQDAASRLEAARERLSQAQRALTAIDQETERSAAAEDAEAVPSHPAVVATLLMKSQGATLPRGVATRTAEVIDRDTSRIDIDPLNQATATLHIGFLLRATDGRRLHATREVTIERKPTNNTAKSRRGAVARPEEVARLLLRDGQAVEQVEQRLAIQLGHGDSKTVGFNRMRRWAAQVGIARPLLHAIIDAPAEVRRALWLVIDGDEQGLHEHLNAIRGNDAWARRLRATYLGDEVATRGSWPLSWAAGQHDDDRAVVAALHQLGGSASVAQVAVAASLDEDVVRSVAMPPAPSFAQSTSAKIAHPPAVLKTDWRGTAEQRVALAACPHDRCDGHVDAPLWTPETDRAAAPRAGVGSHQLAGLCSTCRRLPSDAEATFPEVYLRAWAGPHTRAHGRGRGPTTLRSAKARPREAPSP